MVPIIFLFDSADLDGDLELSFKGGRHKKYWIWDTFESRDYKTCRSKWRNKKKREIIQIPKILASGTA